jgi:hypothetical protein
LIKNFYTHVKRPIHNKEADASKIENATSSRVKMLESDAAMFVQHVSHYFPLMCHHFSENIDLASNSFNLSGFS